MHRALDSPIVQAWIVHACTGLWIVQSHLQNFVDENFTFVIFAAITMLLSLLLFDSANKLLLTSWG